MTPESDSLPLPAAMTIPSLLAQRATERGDHLAVRAGDMEVSYRELVQRAAATAEELSRRGICRGDAVAAICANRIELIDLLLGCSWLGAVTVPLNTALRGAALDSVLEQSGARHLLIDPAFLPRLDQTRFTGEKWVLGTSSVPGPDDRRIPGRAADPAVTALDTAVVLFTSGTTGPPKGVRCPHAQSLWWGAGVGASLGLGPDDVLYNGLPLFHTNALNTLFQALVAGGTFVLGEHFSVRRYWQQVADSDATVIYLLGAMVAMLTGREPGPEDKKHRATRALAPATPARLWAPFRERFGVELVDGYGTTETNLVLGTVPGDRRPGYLGIVREGYDAKVVDDAGATVVDGVAGELVVRTDLPGGFSTGYLSEHARGVGDWFYTGDRVVRESDGWYRFVDRARDVIRRRGENISSAEVEEALSRHPAVEQVAVFPVPSELAEDEVMAAVVLRYGMQLSPLDLRHHAAHQLAYFALPRFIDFVGELPLTETGKVRKEVLRARGVGSNTWDADAVPSR
ncbi:AMP-binding protein [Rhodococcus oxybenzonivorans]|uniref:AMP-binding protein n=1 Tax=Rhodococcus oxybenzonivorans TaxID=1990687 RepID=UPI00295399E2|nr:AMP-binding protein [Rhodococcus oxybenzonivorans]MDV7356026.1 AMP-binding protein [Rhodococcus oxybenzonivorans]